MMWFLKNKNAPKISVDVRCAHIRAALSGFSFQREKNFKHADAIWAARLPQDFYASLTPGQIINHIPNEQCLVDKGELFKHLAAFDKKNIHSIKLKTFFPESYRMYDDNERAQFLSQLPAKNNCQQPWILKPTGLSRGKGMVIFDDYDDIREFCLNPLQNLYDHHVTEQRKYIIQKYITDVLLLDGRKSEMRVYWLIASQNPLLVLMYKEGTIRLNSQPFKLEDFNNPLIHLTNVYQQKKQAHYDPTITLKWSFDELDEYLNLSTSYTKNFLLPRVKNCLDFVMCATREALFEESSYLPFGFYGADFIIDKNLYPWLTEIQFNPGLGFSDPVKKKIIPPMLKDVFTIMLELQRNKRSGLSLKYLNDIGGFLWVINEA